ncbi:hypothetical protein SAMN05216559_0556 [Halomicrobium zhouii]|uniref:DUF7344 domain-containing protein n=1 Tax=Halomicrobium zhouii TaxID=767519 RepID=A0A1I6KCK9_9EURY|nr:hypothetical protein [Halomicrobium zhouii]SFR88951.1 hypothetical protein SAMN05216559_0556 [Halomicrobium zhouii]
MNGARIETAAGPSHGDAGLSEERLFDLLGNERRRSCLQCLASVGGTTTVQELATDVATRVSDEETSPDDIRDSVYISLCQNHLPKLADAGVVGYDSTEKTVGPGPAFPVVERHLQVEATGDGDDEYTSYYALVSLATLLVLGATAYVVPAVQSYGVLSVLAIHALVVVVATARRLRSR